MKQLHVRELAQLLGSNAEKLPVILDVREPWEVEIVHLPGSVCIPMGEIPTRAEELSPDRSIVCMCHHGMRSMQVAVFLERFGLEDVYNLTGGIDAWARQIDTNCATY